MEEAGPGTESGGVEVNAFLLKLLPWYLLATLALCGGVGWYSHHTGYNSGAAAVQVKLDKVNAQLAQERETASEAARAAEKKHAADLAAADATYQENLKDAKTNSDRLVADLRAGNVRLRGQWDACLASAAVPVLAGSAGREDASPGLWPAGEGTVLGDITDQIHDADEADAWIKYLQSVIKADREATGKKP